MSGHYYACVRGDEECPVCERFAQQAALKELQTELNDQNRKAAIAVATEQCDLLAHQQGQIEKAEALVKELLEALKHAIDRNYTDAEYDRWKVLIARAETKGEEQPGSGT